MKLVRAFTVLSASLMSAAWLQADIPNDQHFAVNMLAWNSGELFNAVANQPRGFQAGPLAFCSADGCVPFIPECEGECLASVPDPDVQIDLGLGSIPVGKTWSFNVDADGNLSGAPGQPGDFQNKSGMDFFSVDLTTTDFRAGQIFSCESNLFTFCGFSIENVDQTAGISATDLKQLRVEFADAVVPEPASWALLLTIGGAIAARRLFAKAA